MKKSFFGVIILVGLVMYGVYDYYASRPEESVIGVNTEGVQTGVDKGQLAADFTLKDLQGNPVALSDFRGKIVFLNFWATWCPPCKAEMPHMEKIYQEYQNNDVVFLAVNLTTTEKNIDDVQQFVKEYALTFPVVLDEEGANMEQYRIVSYPTTYVLDKQGIIRETYKGAINDVMMKKTISKLNKASTVSLK